MKSPFITANCWCRHVSTGFFLPFESSNSWGVNVDVLKHTPGRSFFFLPISPLYFFSFTLSPRFLAAHHSGAILRISKIVCATSLVLKTASRSSSRVTVAVADHRFISIHIAILSFFLSLQFTVYGLQLITSAVLLPPEIQPPEILPPVISSVNCKP